MVFRILHGKRILIVFIFDTILIVSILILILHHVFVKKYKLQRKNYYKPVFQKFIKGESKSGCARV